MNGMENYSESGQRIFNALPQLNVVDDYFEVNINQNTNFTYSSILGCYQDIST